MLAAIIVVAMVTLIIVLVQFRDQCLNPGFVALQSVPGVKKFQRPQKKDRDCKWLNLAGSEKTVHRVRLSSKRCSGLFHAVSLLPSRHVGLKLQIE